ncbi:DNA polymerase zeta catalytic subunit isoform X1 [Tanacetum coccineum]
MDIPAISCLSCNANVESANHVFFECDIATDMWKLVFRWCDIPLFQASSWDSFNDWIISWHAIKEKTQFYVITYFGSLGCFGEIPKYASTFNLSKPLRKSIKQNKYVATGSMEELWQAFFANSQLQLVNGIDRAGLVGGHKCVHVGGRIVLNLWQLVRGEVKLNIYTAQAAAEAVLRRKIPHIHCRTLSNWFASGPGKSRYRCIEYVLERAKLNFQVMNQLDMITRTSELARVFGIDFFSLRGSQYHVESMLLDNPVIILDFQSLYPSMVIAYNLCFCTCLAAKPNTLGVSSYTPDLEVLQGLKHEVLLTPNGVMFVLSKVVIASNLLQLKTYCI